MTVLQQLRLVLRLARRELRSGLSGFGVFLACLALGVGAVACVGLVSASVDATLRRDARTLLGGDLRISQTHVPIAANATAYLNTVGVTTDVLTMRSMLRPASQSTATSQQSETPRPGAGESQQSIATSQPVNAPQSTPQTTPQTGPSRRSLLVELKAISPEYPLVGEVILESGISLQEALAAKDGAPGLAVGRNALLRLQLAVGDTVQLGKAVMRIGGVIEREPDRPGGLLSLGPRVLLNRSDLDATGLLQPGSVVTYSTIARLDDPTTAEQVIESLKEDYAGPGWRIRSLDGAAPGLSRFFDSFASYLILVGLASLLVGGIGVANGVRGYLARKDKAIAVFKCLGATRSLVTATYLTQILFLALLGSAMGCAMGAGGALLVAPLLERLMGAPVQISLHLEPLLTALGYGVLTSLAFGLLPLSAAGAVSPARLFRGYADAGRRRATWRAMLGSALCAGSIIALALQDSVSHRVTLGFFGGVLVSMLAFRAFASLLMGLAARLPHPRSPRLRMALANLHRPGAATPAVVFSLGLGLTILAAISLVDGNLQYAIATQFPSRAPAFFFLDIQHTQIDQFRNIANNIPGVTKVEEEPSLRGRIVKIDGVPVEQRTISPDAEWALRGDRGLTFASSPPRGSRITAGAWWPEDYEGPPLLCFDATLARGFGVGVGDTLTVSVLGRELTGTIAVLRNIDWSSLALNHSIVFSPNALAGAPHAYIATAYTDQGAPESDAAEDRLFQAVTSAMPSVVAVGVKEVLADVRRITETIGLAVRGAGLVTVIAGILVLAESLRANLTRRRYESVVFKVLGATGRDVLLVLLWEFLLLGLAAAALAAGLGAALAWAFTDFIMRTEYVLLPAPLLVSLGAGVAVTLALGLWAVRSVLGRSSWEFLRNE